MDTNRFNLVFDLDDTLYKERDYAISCLNYIGKRLAQISGLPNHSLRLIELFEMGKSDPIGIVCNEIGIGNSDRQMLLKEMHAHSPNISLSLDAEVLLSAIRKSGKRLAIITDGRSITQRAKLASLGLQRDVNCLISEEIGAKKPSQTAFKLIQGSSDPQSFIYIADNPRKDFIAPNLLGWQTIMLKDDGRNIHSQADFGSEIARPNREVASLLELLELT